METEPNLIKPHYDLTMSKRTRRPMNLEEICGQGMAANSPERENASKVIAAEFNKELVKQVTLDHRCSKELTEDEKGEEKQGEESQGNNLSEQQCTKEEEKEEEAEEEKRLQLVTVQRGGSVKGVKLGRMVRRYMKVFSHLIRADRKPQLGRNNQVLQLTM